MLAGVHPFHSKDLLTIIRNQIATPTPPMKNAAPSVRVPAALEAVVMRLTEKQADKRYANAKELLDALEQVEGELGLAPAVPSARSQPVVRPVAAAEKVDVVADTLASGAMISTEEALKPGPVVVQDKTPAPRGNGPSLVQALVGRLPEPLRRRPILLAVPVVVLGLSVVLIARPKTPVRVDGVRPAARGAAIARAPEERLVAAKQGGAQELLALREKYPQDARVPRALAHTSMAKEQGLDALRWLAKAAALGGEPFVDEIVQAARMSVATPDGLEAALGMLEGQLGAAGVDALYVLAVTPGPGRIRGRCKQGLEKPQVRALASPALKITLELRAAGSCDDVEALLPRAAKEGDPRTLAFLKTLAQPYNCGPYGLIDCWACLREDDVMKETIGELEKRLR